MALSLYVYRLCKYCRSGFECIVKRLRMVLYKPDCDLMIVNCQVGKPHPVPQALLEPRGVAY